MKKLIVSLTAVAAIVGVLFSAVPTQGQNNAAAPANRTAPAAHRIGLIDMAHVFQNYEKFKAMQTAMQQNMTGVREKAQGTMDKIKQIQEELNSGNFRPDSPEFKQREQESIRLQTELEAYARVTQQENLRKEAEIYKQVYLEVQDAIKVYSRYHGYTLILRFDREAVETASNPQDILNRLTRQVVYHRSEDDLTEVILTHLNQQYQATSTATRPAGATAPATR
ncbi:MAG: OmpH family outer membrane protein [Planctomycetaceae bacterium]